MARPEKPPARMPIREAARLTMRGYAIWWRQYPMMLLSSVAHAAAEALAPYVGIYLSARIIDEIAGQRRPQVLTNLVVASLVAGALVALLIAVLARWRSAQHATNWFKYEKIFTDKLMSLDYRTLEDPRTRDLRSQDYQNNNWGGWGLRILVDALVALTKAVTTIGGAIALSTALFVQRVPASAGPLAALNHPLFLALIVAALLATTFLSPLLANRASAYWSRYADEAKAGNRFFQFFGHMGYYRPRALDIRVYRQDIFCDQMLAKNEQYGPRSPIAKQARGPMGALSALSAAVSQAFVGLVYAFVCCKAWAGAFGVGAATQYIGAVTALSGGIAKLIATLGELRTNADFLRTTFAFLDLPNDMYQGSLSVEKRSDHRYEIEFRDVSFQYPGSDEYALRHVSLTFRVGQRLAVVGRNGSGKTTFIKLLCRLYDPTEGEILLNGIDIRKYSYAQYLSIFSVVFQDYQLVSLFLGQNVAARVRYDAAKAVDCLNGAGFGERLKALPRGLDTPLYRALDDTGIEISGGEAQKIALARALYKEAPFVVLDEPTAALDPVAEFDVYHRMNEIVGDKTAVFISHRLSSCRFCHDIAVFHEGRLVQRGSHAALVAKEGGAYAELWGAQAQYYA